MLLIFIVYLHFYQVAGATVCKGRNFELSDDKLSQPNAKKYCQGKGGNLASIYDEATQNQISKQANDKVGNGWIFTREIYAFLGGERIGNSFAWSNGTIFSTQTSPGSWTWTYYGYNNWYNGVISGAGTCMGLYGKRSGTTPYTYTWSFNGNISGLYLDPLNLTVTQNGKITMINEKMFGTNFSYKISKVTLEHNGLYRFAATNRFNNCSLEFNLTISVGSLQMTLNEASPLVVNFNESRSVTCSCGGYDQPRCVWFRASTEVSKDNSREIYQVSNPSSSTLHINIKDACDGGEYKCQAVNWFGGGSNNKQFNIHVIPIMTTTSTQTKAAAGTTINQNCKSCGFPKPSVTWTKLKNGATNNVQQTNQISGCCTTSILNISKVEASYGGFYQCSVTSNGRTQTKNLNVTVIPTVSLTKNVIVASNGKVSVQCTGTGYPTPSILWMR